MKPLLLSLSAAMLALPLMVQAAGPAHHHDHGAGASHSIQLNAGKLTAAGYDALANDIDSRIAYIVGNCKLDPKADEQLHIVIGELAGGVDMMKGKQPGQARAMGVVNASQTLNTYGKYFNHPGWKAIKLPH